MLPTMNATPKRNALLAAAGLGALLVYILACTAFSPDDTKLLYPAFDRETGAVGIWMYDREAKRSEPVFTPMGYGSTDDGLDAAMLRPAWSPDGRNILVIWPGQPGASDASDGLNLAILPAGRPGPVRLLALPFTETAQHLMNPLAMSGNAIFLIGQEGATNYLVRLDITTGRSQRRAVTNDVELVGTADGRQVFYVRQVGGSNDPLEFGAVNARTLELTPRFQFPPPGGGEPWVLCLSANGSHLAVAGAPGEHSGLRLIPTDRPDQLVEIAMPAGCKRLTGLVFRPDGKTLYAAGVQREKVGDSSRFGLYDIPLDSRSVRWIPLTREAAPFKDSDALFFQPGVSHNGQTVALATTYLCVESNDVTPSDCSLFLVDVGDPQRRVTRVPVPLPKRAVRPKP
jgi:hypothetical protein